MTLKYYQIIERLKGVIYTPKNRNGSASRPGDGVYHRILLYLLSFQSNPAKTFALERNRWDQEKFDKITTN